MQSQRKDAPVLLLLFSLTSRPTGTSTLFRAPFLALFPEISLFIPSLSNPKSAPTTPSPLPCSDSAGWTGLSSVFLLLFARSAMERYLLSIGSATCLGRNKLVLQVGSKY
ncbi:hypothetical protein BT69DRAFT_197111 [Atractiella rhizophila]|nr:hypothetical protein BT69DRAFT_197111 [Atractiella rhizophila]